MFNIEDTIGIVSHGLFFLLFSYYFTFVSIMCSLVNFYFGMAIKRALHLVSVLFWTNVSTLKRLLASLDSFRCNGYSKYKRVYSFPLFLLTSNKG